MNNVGLNLWAQLLPIAHVIAAQQQEQEQPPAQPQEKQSQQPPKARETER